MQVLTDQREEDTHSIIVFWHMKVYFTMPVDATGQHRTSEIILRPWKINQLKPKQRANWEKQRLFFFKSGDLKSSSALFFQILTSLLGVPDIL